MARRSSCFLGGLAAGWLVACSGGGSGSPSTGTEPGVNEGSYSVNDFNYTDHRPAGQHPLGSEGFKAIARDEWFAVIPPAGGTDREHSLWEGPDESYAAVTQMDGIFDGLGSVYSAAKAQLDGDAEDELVAVVRQSSQWVQVVRVDRQANGSYVREVIQGIPSSSFALNDVRVSVADIDNDFRDEIFVVARPLAFGLSASQGEVWGFQDPLDGGGQILNFVRQGNHLNLWAHGVDTDGDGAQELVIGLSGDTTDSGRYAIRLYGLPEGELAMQQRHGWQYLYSEVDFDYGRLAVGDYDGDGREDLAWVGYKRTTDRGQTRVKLFEWAPNQTWQEYGSFASITVNPTDGVTANRLGVTSFYPRVGQADLAVAYPDANGWRYTAYHFDRGSNQWSYQLSGFDRTLPEQTVALAAADVDSDGVQEVQVALLHFGADRSMDLGYLEHEDPVQQVWQARRIDPTDSIGGGQRPVVVLAPGDYDADGFVLEHTGRRDVKVGTPIPLVLLSAPPTKAGISQNYDDTESLYSMANTQGSGIDVTTHSAITYGAEAGFDLFGILGVSGRASLDKASERTRTRSRHETNVTGFRGAYDADVLIFQGTLYETYEYVIRSASDPAAIGALVTLDYPVDANTYKWTVDYYNSQVPAEDRIGSDVLTHTAGVIESYPSRFAMQALMAGEVAWELEGARPVSQSSGSDFQSVSFAEENATSLQRTVTKSYGGGLSIGIGGTIDKTNSEATTHSTFFGTEATFEASVGDIADPADYEAWRYRWGFAVHTVGRLADGNNVPTGYTARKHHFQYLRYWVDLNGTGYGPQP